MMNFSFDFSVQKMVSFIMTSPRQMLFVATAAAMTTMSPAQAEVRVAYTQDGVVCADAHENGYETYDGMLASEGNFYGAPVPETMSQFDYDQYKGQLVAAASEAFGDKFETGFVGIRADAQGNHLMELQVDRDDPNQRPSLGCAVGIDFGR